MEAMAGAGICFRLGFSKKLPISICPKPWRAVKSQGPGDITLTNQLGVGAGEEILQQFHKAISTKI